MEANERTDIPVELNRVAEGLQKEIGRLKEVNDWRMGFLESQLELCKNKNAMPDGGLEKHLKEFY